MNQKIQCLIDGGFISTNDVMEHAGYLESQINDYYENQYPKWPEDCQDTMDEDRKLRDEMMMLEDMYGHELDQEMELSSEACRSENPEYIVASTSYKLDETYLFEADENGKILNWGEYGGLALRWGNENWADRDKTMQEVFPGLYHPVKDLGFISNDVRHSLYKRNAI